MHDRDIATGVLKAREPLKFKFTLYIWQAFIK